jgi:hypothetical protein
VARPYDAAALLELKHQLDRETAFMMYEPDERDSPVRDLAAELASLGRSANSVILLAELADQLIGYVQLTGGSLRRSRATAYVVIGVLARAAVLLPAPPATGLSLARHSRSYPSPRHAPYPSPVTPALIYRRPPRSRLAGPFGVGVPPGTFFGALCATDHVTEARNRPRS